jgi:hypothetical protein
VSFATARFQWEEGARYLAAAQEPDRRAIERVSDHIVDELRRRLGGPFRTAELVELYERASTGWCTDVAVQAAPDQPWAWDVRIVCDAAFGRYVREAGDFAGGRLTSREGGG